LRSHQWSAQRSWLQAGCSAETADHENHRAGHACAVVHEYPAMEFSRDYRRSAQSNSREYKYFGSYAGAHRQRQVEVAKQLFGAMGIAREDQERRQQWVLRGFRQFDAPESIIISYDRTLHGDDLAIFDCDAVATALVNAAWLRGLGCVINSQDIMQSPVVREHAGIPDDQVIMISIAMGYPDEAFPANQVVTARKPLHEIVRFVGFPD
jgi:nitroreductase